MPHPFGGRLFNLTQPDGTTFRVQAWGDQHAALFRTLDGFWVVPNQATGFYEYAAADDRSVLQATGLRAGIDAAAEVDPKQLATANIGQLLWGNLSLTGGMRRGIARWQQRAIAKRNGGKLAWAAASEMTANAVPTRASVGQYTGVCVLVQFPDVPGAIEPDEVEPFLNAPGYSGFGNNGSVRDYFLEASSGRLDYRTVVTPYITTRFRRSHYADRQIPYGERARELVLEVLDALTAMGFDFSVLTSDEDEYIRALNLFYAGQCVNNPNEGLWPHNGFLDYSIEVAPARRAYDYQITNLGDELSLGTYCHENGHLVCDFPDLYDGDWQQGEMSFGAGDYCLMSAGGLLAPKNPPNFGAYLKFRAGWADSLTPIQPNRENALPATGNHFYVHAKDQKEYFLLEYRQQTGRDAAIPSSGLAIWHIDEQGNNRNQQGTREQHYECALMQADGRRDLESNINPGDADDLYPNGGKVEFSVSTSPGSRWWDGTDSELAIRQITQISDGVTFRS